MSTDPGAAPGPDQTPPSPKTLYMLVSKIESIVSSRVQTMIVRQRAAGRAWTSEELAVELKKLVEADEQLVALEAELRKTGMSTDEIRASVDAFRASLDPIDVFMLALSEF